MTPNYIAHYVDGSTNEYMYSIPYYWPVENDLSRNKFYAGMKYRTLEQYEELKNKEL